MKRTSITANKAHFDWIDSKQREKGIYKVKYTKTINEVEQEIVETTKIGRDFVIISTETTYNPGYTI